MLLRASQAERAYPCSEHRKFSQVGHGAHHACNADTHNNYIRECATEMVPISNLLYLVQQNDADVVAAVACTQLRDLTTLSRCIDYITGCT